MDLWLVYWARSDYALQVGDLVYITDYSSSREDIVEMEKWVHIVNDTHTFPKVLTLCQLI